MPLQLADALKSNSCITSLDLSQNHISDEGAQVCYGRPWLPGEGLRRCGTLPALLAGRGLLLLLSPPLRQL